MTQESVGISNRLQTPATPRFVDRQGALSATLGLATLGLGTPRVSERKNLFLAHLRLWFGAF